MIFLSQAQIDALLLEDIQGGDLTTRALNIGHQHGYIEFFHRQGGCVSGISVACKMLTTLGLTIDDAVSDGSQANAGGINGIILAAVFFALFGHVSSILFS